jgi:hypothetical protein
MIMNKPQRNNNPVNLRYAGQANSHKTDDNFADFDYPHQGWIAAHKQIELDQGRGLTFEKFIAKFAPPNENNTSQYLQFVCTQLKVTPETPLKDVSKFAIAGVMAAEEGYYAN